MLIEKLPSDVFIYMAVNLGLLILAAWFYILLLILREFRLFAKNVQGNNQSGKDNHYLLQQCRDAIDRSMRFIVDNQKTIQELASIQSNLEQQLVEIKTSTQDHITKDEQTKIDEFNRKLIKSHKLIKKLKGDLDSSIERLKVTRRKLYDQYESTEQLQKENQELRQQLEESHTAAGPSEKELEQLVANFERERQDMSHTINEYKRQIAEQSQALQQLIVQEQEVEDGAKLQEIKAELEQTREALHHLSKEKKFIESRYLEMVNSQNE